MLHIMKKNSTGGDEKMPLWVGCVCVVSAAHCLIESDGRIVNFEGTLEGREAASGTPGSS